MILFSSRLLKRWSRIILLSALFVVHMPAASEALINGGVISGEISAPFERDTYTFAANAGESVQIRAAATSSLSPRIFLYDPGGTQIATNTISPSSVAAIHCSNSLACKISGSGTYSVAVQDSRSNGEHTGSYDVYFVLIPGANEGGSLTNGGITSDQIDIGDLDSYTFNADAGANINLRVETPISSPLDLRVSLYHPSGELIYPYTSPSNIIEITCPSNVCKNTESGTHTLVIADDTAGKQQTGSYNVEFGITNPSVSLSNIRITQAVFGSDFNNNGIIDLVKDRSTAILVNINYENLQPAQVNIKAELQNGTVLASEVISLSGTGTDMDFPLILDKQKFPITVGNQQITVSASIGNNNIYFQNLATEVHDTKNLKVHYGFADGGYYQESEFIQHANQSQNFILNLFPLPQNKLIAERFSTDFRLEAVGSKYDDYKLMYILRDIDRFALQLIKNFTNNPNIIERLVVIVPDNRDGLGYFENRCNETVACNSIGLTTSLIEKLGFSKKITPFSEKISLVKIGEWSLCTRQF